MLRELENSISDTGIKHILPIEQSNSNLLSITIPADSKIITDNTPLSGLEMPDNCLVCLVVRNGAHLRPSNNLVLQSGDQVIVAGYPNNELMIYNIFTGV